MFSLFKLGVLAVILFFNGGALFAQEKEQKERSVISEECFSKLEIPDLSNLVEKGYSLYLGLWPAENLCQAILVKSFSVKDKLMTITYSYYGEKQKPGSVSVTGSFTENKAYFTLPYKGRPDLEYDFSSGKSFYKNSTGLYEGWFILRNGPGILSQ
jgi:hypothetical protein